MTTEQRAVRFAPDGFQNEIFLMPSPTLKKLSKPGLQSSEIAALLEKHIGDGSSEVICKQAFEAVERLKDEQLVIPAYVTIRIVDSKMTYAKKVQTIINHLRTVSGKTEDEF